MDLTIILAKFWGIFLLVTSLGLIINRKNILTAIRSIDNSTFSILVLNSGVLALIIGVLHVLVYDNWEGYGAIVGVLGYIVLIKGILRMFFPNVVISWARRIGPSFLTWSSIIFLVVGLYLGYNGFFPPSLEVLLLGY